MSQITVTVDQFLYHPILEKLGGFALFPLFPPFSYMYTLFPKPSLFLPFLFIPLLIYLFYVAERERGFPSDGSTRLCGGR